MTMLFSYPRSEVDRSPVDIEAEGEVQGGICSRQVPHIKTLNRSKAGHLKDARSLIYSTWANACDRYRTVPCLYLTFDFA